MASTDVSRLLSDYDFLREIGDVADETGVKAFLVGGFVRDLFLDRPRTDVDIMTLGDGPAFAEACAARFGLEKVSIFRRFGTAHFRLRSMDIEIVGARKESYSEESRNPEVAPASFEEDIARRDFTVNAMAAAITGEEYGELIDLFGGLADLERRLLRTPLDPNVTFDDDPLRILRAFRFAAQLAFDIHEDVLAAAESNRERLRIVSAERITEELLKTLAAPKPSVGLTPMFRAGVLEVVFPEIANLAGVDSIRDRRHKDVFYHTMQVVDNVAEASENVWLRFAALTHDVAKPATKKFVEGTGWTFHAHDEIGARMIKGIFRRLKLPHAKRDYVAKLVRLHLRPMALAKEEVTDSAIRRLIVEADEDLDDLILLARADITSKNRRKVDAYLRNYDRVMTRVREVKEKDALRAFQSPVRGEEIMRVCDIKPSKTVGEIKSAIEEAILEGEIPNTYDAAYNYFLKIKDRFLDDPDE
ncbi:MAG: HD domain-containing protein [Ignavibacteriales bacterium]|nr:HD domain-containing protein [Ignavibacteriales bacterium]